MAPRKDLKARSKSEKHTSRARKDTTVARPLSPAIGRLPSELLVHIFKLCIQHAKDGPYDWLTVNHRWWYNCRAVLALVCRFWKDILYGNRHFWTPVDMTLIKRRRLYIANARGAPVEAVWDITRVRRWVKPPKFPVFLFRRLSRAGNLTSLRITDAFPVLKDLDDVDLSSVEEFRYEQRTGFGLASTSAVLLKLLMPSLTTICLSDITLRGQGLFNLLQQAAKTLKYVELQQCTLDDGSAFTQGGLSLPQLKHMKVIRPYRAMQVILYTVKDASAEATIEVYMDNEELADLVKLPRFQEVFCPLNIAHAREDDWRVTFTEEKHTSRPRFMAHISVKNSWRELTGNIFFDPAHLRSPVLETLQLKGIHRIMAGKTLSTSLLPPSRTMEIFAECALEVLAWLREHGSDERTAPLETVILNEVPLMNTGPHSPLVRDIVTEDAASKRWEQHHRMFTDLLAFLQARREGGSPVDLVLRGGEYEDGVVRDLRPFAKELVVEENGSATTVEPRHSSRLAAKTAS